MSNEEKAEIMREIVNLLAKKKCTVTDAEDILNGAGLSIKYSTIIQHIN